MNFESIVQNFYRKVKHIYKRPYETTEKTRYFN